MQTTSVSPVTGCSTTGKSLLKLLGASSNALSWNACLNYIVKRMFCVVNECHMLCMPLCGSKPFLLAGPQENEFPDVLCRWTGKKASSINGHCIEFINAGGRTTAYVPALQKLAR
jgi:hypothetical protein